MLAAPWQALTAVKPDLCDTMLQATDLKGESLLAPRIPSPAALSQGFDPWDHPLFTEKGEQASHGWALLREAGLGWRPGRACGCCEAQRLLSLDPPSLGECWARS